MQTKSNPTGYKISVFLLLAGILILSSDLLLQVGSVLRATLRSPNSFGAVDGRLLVQIPQEQLPEHTLYISSDRRDYEGGMRLLIPELSLDTPVGESTEPDLLRHMPGLYEFSQMPWEDGGNVSIAGHRDIHNMEFLSLDRLNPGDTIYLIIGDRVFQYSVSEIELTDRYRWSVIHRRNVPSITLTTCDPVGTAVNRLVVIGTLEQELPREFLEIR